MDFEILLMFCSVSFRWRWERERKGKGKERDGKGKGKGKKTSSYTRWAARRWEGGIEGLGEVEGE